MFKKFFSLTIAFLLMFIWVTPAMASPSFLSSDTGFINITNAINDDVYIAGGQVVIEENINGDLFIGGGDVDVKGNVNGDVIIFAAGSVLIRGDVADDLRVGAGNVTVEGTIGDDVLVGTGILIIADTAVIKGDLISGSEDFRLYGKVLGNVKSDFRQGEITGTINGYANLTYEGKLNVGENASVLGRLTYMAPTENPDLVNIAESIEYRQQSSRWANRTIPFLSGTALAWLIPSIALGGLILKYLSILLFGGLLMWLLPKYMPRIATQIKKDYFSNLWQGILFLVIVPVLTFVSLLILIGWPIGLALMSSYVVMLLIAGLIASLVIGGYFVKLNSKSSKSKQFAGLAIGAAVYVLLIFVPFIGWFIKIIFVSLAIGGMWKDSLAMIKAGKY